MGNSKLVLAAKKLRKQVLDLVATNGEPHIGGCFSEIEILITLFNNILKNEDRFLLSKGHGYYPFYLLLKEKGYNPQLASHNNLDIKNGIYNTAGSYGHGYPMAVGMALAEKIKKTNGHIYVLLGESDSEEGTMWESSLIASFYKLDNLIVIIDRNKIQAIDRTENVLPLENLRAIFESMKFHVCEVNGHDYNELTSAFEIKVSLKPKLIIANTIKGKGVSFMENDPKWHSRFPTDEEFKAAYRELM